VLANVLFAQMDDLVAAARRGLDDINGQRHRMGFVFNHDDILGNHQEDWLTVALPIDIHTS
jgi:hypothetical protein